MRLAADFSKASCRARPSSASSRSMPGSGRQELTLGSGRFVWINESSNVRTTQDGARLHVASTGGGTLDGATVDLVVSRPVTPTYTAFDDWNSHAGSFGAVYASEPFLANQLHVPTSTIIIVHQSCHSIRDAHRHR